MQKRPQLWAALGALLFLMTAAAYWRSEILWLIRYELSSPMQAAHAAIRPRPCPGCNLILVSLDTLRADHTGVGLTPNLDKIAARSLAFTNAFTPGFFTTPSHMSVFTGTYPNTHQVQSRNVRLSVIAPEPENVPHRKLSDRLPTLAEVLRAKGYHTYWVGPLHSKFLELEDGFGRGFEDFRTSAFDRGVNLPGFPHQGFDAGKLNGLKQPGFYFLHAYVAHSPYLRLPPAQVPPGSRILFAPRILEEYAAKVERTPFYVLGQYDLRLASKRPDAQVLSACGTLAKLQNCFDLFDGDRDPFWHVLGAIQISGANKARNRLDQAESFAAEESALRAAYKLSVQELDRQVGQLWNELERRDLLKNSLVVFFSDHGHELFEHGGASHSTFYDHTARVPLMIYNPREPQGMRVDELVSLVDLMPMTLDLLGDGKPGPSMQGTLPWKEKSPFVYGYSLGADFVRDMNWKLIREASGREHLFYLPADPLEKQDLITFKNPVVRRQYARLAQARAEWELKQSLLVSHREQND